MYYTWDVIDPADLMLLCAMVADIKICHRCKGNRLGQLKVGCVDYEHRLPSGCRERVDEFSSKLANLQGMSVFEFGVHAMRDVKIVRQRVTVKYDSNGHILFSQGIDQQREELALVYGMSVEEANAKPDFESSVTLTKRTPQNGCYPFFGSACNQSRAG
jgi:hypothetical protein